MRDRDRELAGQPIAAFRSGRVAQLRRACSEHLLLAIRKPRSNTRPSSAIEPPKRAIRTFESGRKRLARTLPWRTTSRSAPSSAPGSFFAIWTQELSRASRCPDKGADLLSRRGAPHCRASNAPELRGKCARRSPGISSTSASDRRRLGALNTREPTARDPESPQGSRAAAHRGRRARSRAGER
jgi:hypothetical protein